MDKGGFLAIPAPVLKVQLKFRLLHRQMPPFSSLYPRFISKGMWETGWGEKKGREGRAAVCGEWNAAARLRMSPLQNHLYLRAQTETHGSMCLLIPLLNVSSSSRWLDLIFEVWSKTYTDLSLFFVIFLNICLKFVKTDSLTKVKSNFVLILFIDWFIAVDLLLEISNRSSGSNSVQSDVLATVQEWGHAG